MPARRIRGDAVPVRRFDVLGFDSAAQPGFIVHVGLSARNRRGLRRDDIPFLVHMKPPLLTNSAATPASSIGTARLTLDEILQMRMFIDDVAAEYASEGLRDSIGQYCISPHFRPWRERNGTVVCRQFSCAGLVLEAYGFAGVHLIATDPERLPWVGLETLKTQYPEIADRLENPLLRERLGIAGDGPWRIVLAGYVMSAFNRSESEIRTAPHQPIAGDEFFPPRPKSPLVTSS